MPELFDTSNIPDRPDYWDGLAQRVSTRAMQRRSTFVMIAESRISWTAASLAAAAALALLLLPAGSLSTEAPRLGEVLAPADQLGKVMTGDRPPLIGELLIPGENTRGAR